MSNKHLTHIRRHLLDRLTAFMLAYNEKINLTAITDPDEIYEKHYIDCALPLELLSRSAPCFPPRFNSSGNVPRGTLPIDDGAFYEEAKVIDVGTGAGFPGVIWKLARPDLRITLLDSLRKRIDYLKLLRAELDIKYDAIHSRSEELALKPEHREQYDITVSRALAKLPALCELCLPFVRVGGLFLAMKGGDVTELAAADNALRLLGGSVREVKAYELPSGDKRNLIVIEKTAHTPLKYPRQRVNIAKNPL